MLANAFVFSAERCIRQKTFIHVFFILSLFLSLLRFFSKLEGFKSLIIVETGSNDQTLINDELIIGSSFLWDLAATISLLIPSSVTWVL